MTLSLNDVTVTVPDGRDTLTILDHVSLEVNPGDVVALSGISGSGKSTLVAVAGLLLRPDSGSVAIGGVDASGLNERERTRVRRKSIGVVYQTANLFPSLTAVDQVALVAHVNGRLDSEARSRARELLVTMGLESRLDARPGQLSGGERQRVSIARALMNGPSILLADEPTAALDVARGHQIMDLLVEQARQFNTATVVVTHLLEQIAATRHVTIEDGRLIEGSGVPTEA